MMISLITATIGRTKEVRVLLESLCRQSYKDFELIIVDQNEHREIEIIADDYRKKMNIIYVRSCRKGLSHNRNIGLKYVQGDIIGFPDDDCFYDSNLLETVNDIFRKNSEKVKLVSVGAKDTLTNSVFIGENGFFFDRKSLLYNCISYNFFIRKAEGLEFDEALGVGATFGSGEETDFLWSFFKKGDVGIMSKSTFVNHPMNDGPVNETRAYSYGLGFGAMFKKEVFYRKHYMMLFEYFYGLFRAFGGMIFKSNHKTYYKSLLGRILGFLKYKP